MAKMTNKEFNQISTLDAMRKGEVTTPDTHYTSIGMCSALLSFLDIKNAISFVDCGCGREQGWLQALANMPESKKFKMIGVDIEPITSVFADKKNIKVIGKTDFIKEFNIKVDWCIGNPPFKLGQDFVWKACEISKKGFAFLGSHNFLNSFMIPSRLQKLIDLGFTINKIVVCQDKRWYGRYYFIICEKNFMLKHNLSLEYIPKVF